MSTTSQRLRTTVRRLFTLTIKLLTYTVPDLPEGEKKTLAEIHESLKDENWKKEFKERQEELIQELIDFRETKRTGTRANNKAATNDIIATCDRVAIEVCALQ